MEIDIKNIKCYSVEEIYSYLISIIEKIYNSYKFIDIDENDYKIYVLNLIKDNLKEIEKVQKDKFELFFEYKINLMMEDCVKESLKSDEPWKIIINYINGYINQTNNVNDAINELKNLSQFLNKYQYNLVDEICIKIILESTKIRKLLDVIIKENEVININDYITKMFIYNYCIIKGIDNIIISNKSDQKNSIEYDMNLYFTTSEDPLSAEEEYKLLYEASKGDVNAKNELIYRNLKFVIYKAKKYFCNGLDFDDLIQYGSIGLMKAIDKFDLSKDNRLSAYAAPCIESSIKEGIIESGRNIKLPAKMYNNIIKYMNIQRQLLLELGREPTSEEISKKLDLPLSKIIQIQKNINDTISIDSIISDEEGTTLGAFIQDDSCFENEVIDNIIISSTNSKLKEVLNSELTKKEQMILIFNFGLFGNKRHTLRKTGDIVNLSPERVRQILNKAILKLRKPKNACVLKECFSDSEEEIASFKEKTKKKISISS